MFGSNDAYKVARDQLATSVCIECPDCVDCTKWNALPRILAGFHLSDGAINSGRWFQTNGDTREKIVIRCRPESLDDEKIKDERIKALSDGTLLSSIAAGTLLGWQHSNDPSYYPDDFVQCVGTPVVDGAMLGLTCAHGHKGTLCGECVDDFGKKDENKCVLCGDALQLKSVLILVTTISGVVERASGQVQGAHEQH